MSPRDDAGVSLLELLIATAITATVAAAVFAVVSPSQGIAESQPELADIQQRLRVGVDLLRHDLLMAGTGKYSGAFSGNLAAFFAPILPFRRGASAAYDDGPGVFRDDAVTIVYVRSTAAQTTLRAPMTDGSRAEVNADSGCPVADPACGFRAGTDAVVFDGTGAFDLFSVTAADASGALALQPAQRVGTTTYNAGSGIAEVVRHSYFLDRAAAQLLRYDGLSAAAAVLENVVALEFEYYGLPDAPAFRRPGVDRTVTYGPAPPDVDVGQREWPPGENCTWQKVGGVQTPRLPSLGATAALVRLTASQLTDGPWCPNPLADNRYDADLLRIRKVRVGIRLQTGNARLRTALSVGRGGLFVNPGTATSMSRVVPDQSIRFDVTPRNLNLGR